MEGIIFFIGVVGVAILGFMGYYVFKQIQFFLTATTLYKTMIQKQETTIQLLIDIRDNTRSVNVESIKEEVEVKEEDGEMEEAAFLSEYTLQAWDSRKREIIDALKSDDSTEKEWALNELKNFSPVVKEAEEILEQMGANKGE